MEDDSAARELAGGDLCVGEEDAIAEPEDFFYSHRIEGWQCEDTRGLALGRVAGLERTAGVPMLAVDTGRAEPISIPFTRPIVVSIDAERRRIVLDPPEGLLDL